MGCELPTLCRCPLLRPVSAGMREAISSAGRVRRWPSGSHLFQEGEPGTPMLRFLVDGAVRLSKISRQGKETVLQVLRPGDCFDPGDAFGSQHGMSARAEVESVVYELERAALDRLISQSPEIGQSLMQCMSDHLRSLQDRLHVMGSERAATRLARTIHDQAERYGRDESGQLRHQLSYRLLAAMTGVTYEETVRIMRHWAADGVLNYSRNGTVVLKDQATLEQLAGLGRT